MYSLSGWSKVSLKSMHKYAEFFRLLASNESSDMVASVYSKPQPSSNTFLNYSLSFGPESQNVKVGL